MIISFVFSVDCLEILEEIEGENCEIFEYVGGEKYWYILVFNICSDYINVIFEVIKLLFK